MSASSDNIRIRCPGCESTLTGPAKLRGRTLTCPKCRTQIEIPLSTPHPTPADSLAAGHSEIASLDPLFSDSDMAHLPVSSDPAMSVLPVASSSKSKGLPLGFLRYVRLTRNAKLALLAMAWVLLTLFGLLVPAVNLYVGMFLFLVGLLFMGIGFIALFVKLIGQDPGEFLKYLLLSQFVGGFLASQSLDPEKRERRGKTKAGIAGTFFILGAILFFAGFVNVLLASLSEKAAIESKLAHKPAKEIVTRMNVPS